MHHQMKSATLKGTDPVLDFIYLFTLAFTFRHLADAFIKSVLQKGDKHSRYNTMKISKSA